jgi:hypothetical protein
LKLIAHRANFNGDQFNENSPTKVQEAVAKGFDVEVDIRYNIYTNSWHLGHDFAQWPVTLEWITAFAEVLWIHCKNIEAMHYFQERQLNLNWFWHENDSYTLTSKGFIWTFPGRRVTPLCVIVMPELYLSPAGIVNDVNWNSVKQYVTQSGAFAVCSDCLTMY